MIASGMVVAKIAARLLALIALGAVAVAVYVIVHNGLSHHATTVRHPGSTQVSGGASHGGARHRRTPRYYVVKAGDTLSGIAIKTRVALASLVQLNPGLSPNSLQTGQRLRLRR